MKLSKLCRDLFRDPKTIPEPFTIPEGSFIKRKFNFGKQDVINFRRIMKKKGEFYDQGTMLKNSITN
jgi:hypothetical protein